MSMNVLHPDVANLRKSKRGEPTWELAGMFPLQGDWTEEEYLRLTGDHLVELDNGCLELLPMPGFLHQAIVGFLYTLLNRFVTEARLGKVLFAPFPVHLGPRTYREPDLVFLKTSRIDELRRRDPNGQPDGADLVVEVVSPGAESRHRDLVEKREAYALAGIAEYWIVDMETRTVTVLVLEGAAYRVHGDFGIDATATSVLLGGFAVSVRDVFESGSESE